MDPTATRPPAAAEPPPTTAFAALAQGWRMWGRAPLPVFVVAWLPLAGSIVFSIVPGVGGLLSTLASGALAVVTWLCLDAVARGGDPAPGAALAAALRRPAVMLAIAIVSLLLGIAVAIATAPASGAPVSQVVLQGLPADTRPSVELVIGAMMVAPAAWLLQWMPPRMLYAGRSAPQALVDCLLAFARRPALMLGFASVSIALGVLGVVTVIGIGLVLPWLTAASYAVYRGLFGDAGGASAPRSTGDDGDGEGGGTLVA